MIFLIENIHNLSKADQFKFERICSMKRMYVRRKPEERPKNKNKYTVVTEILSFT